MGRRPKIGDLFEVKIDASRKRYFHYIADDASQLGSNVVRVFCDTYGLDDKPDTRRILNGRIDLHAHVLLIIGIRKKLWTKAGHGTPPRDIDSVLFRGSKDSGKQVAISKNWYVWKINGPSEDIGELKDEYQKAEIGVVMPPEWLIFRMRTGKFNFVYPEY